MVKISSTKIGIRAVDYLRRIIDLHCTMHHSFYENDTNEIWDGFIILPKVNNGKISKDNLAARIPVQIKGHHDGNHDFFDKDKISHKVELTVLNGFGSEKGGLYFIIYVDDKGNGQIFYASLYSSKVADYIEKCGKQKSVNIPFYRLEGNPDELYNVAKQFDIESKKQGSVDNALVKNRIRIDAIKQLKEMNMEVFGQPNMLDIVKGLSNGSICMYGKEKEDEILRPIQWSPNQIFGVGYELEKNVKVGETVFYKKYNSFVDSDDNVTLSLSKNLKFIIKENKILFEYNSTIEELYNDALFLLALSKESKIIINDKEWDIGSIEINDDFKTKTRYAIDLYEVLKMIGFDINIDYSQLNKQERADLYALINYKRGDSQTKIPEGISSTIWKYDSKKVPLFVIKEKDIISLVNAAYPVDRVIGVSSENGGNEKEIYRVPPFMFLSEEMLSNLYEYNYDEFDKQIEQMELNEKTYPYLLEAGLKLINVFDNTDDLKILEYADNLFDDLMDLKKEDYLILNKMQIKKRRENLSNSDLELIENIDEKDIYIEFGKSVLLDNKEEADRCFKMFPIDEKNRYKKYPIYSLYENM